MFSFQKSAKEKLRVLRETHKISTIQEAEFLGFKSNGSIGQIETGLCNPTLDKLDDVVNFFSVSFDWLAGRISCPYQEKIIEPIENSLIADRDKDDEWLAYYRLSSWMTGEDIYADSVKRAQSFSLPVRANMIFALQVLRHTSIFFHSLQSKASFDGKQLPSEAFSYYPAFHRIFYPMTVAHEGKRKANIRWNHCSACYDLLVEYIKGSRDRNRPVFDICKSRNKENAVSPRQIGEYEKNLSEPDKSEYAVSPLLCGENVGYQKCKKGAS